MAIYTYFLSEGQDNDAVQIELQNYMDQCGFLADQVIQDEGDHKQHWHKRPIGDLMQGDEIQSGDTLIVYEASQLARSTSQMIEILIKATQIGLNIHFVKYPAIFEAKKLNQLESLLAMMQHIECDYIAKRTTDALARRREAGLPLGRPKGRKNKSLKLDQHRKKIMDYLKLNVSKASIAKLVGCHPQTLYDWLDRQGIETKKSKRGRGAITAKIIEEAGLI